MANFITSVRILCSIALLFCPVLSIAFYVLYLFAGISDILDGMVARKTNTVSEFGSKLDTIADFLFTAVCLIKLLPIFKMETWMYLWIAGIAVVKIVNVVSGYVMRKKLVVVHSVMNKVTGALLFALPISVTFVDLRYSAILVCAVATLAAMQEGHFIRTRRCEQTISLLIAPLISVSFLHNFL